MQPANKYDPLIIAIALLILFLLRAIQEQREELSVIAEIRATYGDET